MPKGYNPKAYRRVINDEKKMQAIFDRIQQHKFEVLQAHSGLTEGFIHCTRKIQNGSQLFSIRWFINMEAEHKCSFSYIPQAHV